MTIVHDLRTNIRSFCAISSFDYADSSSISDYTFTGLLPTLSARMSKSSLYFEWFFACHGNDGAGLKVKV